MTVDKHYSKSNLKRTAELRALILNLPVKKAIISGKPVYSSNLIEEGSYAGLIRDKGLSDALQGSDINEGPEY
jgi:hypothetical protein